MSKVTEYSRQMLQAFEDSLPVTWTDEGLPMMLPDHIEIKHILAFHSAYHDINYGQLRNHAITDLENYSRGDDTLQTSGVGLAEDFNLFVNIGLLTGSRVVLWDTVILGTFFPPDGKFNKEDIAIRTCELLSLKQIILDGGAVMLPHPGIWLERCQRYFAAIADIKGLTPAFFGYLNARALKDEGFNLHPYTLLDSKNSATGSNLPITKGLSIGDTTPLVDKRNDKDELSVRDLVFDARFDYLKGISSENLYKILCQFTNWKQEIASKLRIPDYMTTTSDIQNYLGNVKVLLLEGINKQNASIKIQKANVLAAGLGTIGCCIGIAASPYDAGQVLGAVGGSISLSTAWLEVSRLFKNQKEDVATIYQGFRRLQECYMNDELNSG